MFTGLIEEVGLVRRIVSARDGYDITVDARRVVSGLQVGDSIAVNGPCLTATATTTAGFTAWAMPETLKKSNLGMLRPGDRVNLERALALGDRLGGHLVSGHIDSMVALRMIQSEGGAVILTFGAPPGLMQYIVDKGSVAIDGVSLTVIKAAEAEFSVGIIPHTASETTLSSRAVGDMINLEVDIIGKYVEKMLDPYQHNGPGKRNRLTLDMLKDNGYL